MLKYIHNRRAEKLLQTINKQNLKSLNSLLSKGYDPNIVKKGVITDTPLYCAVDNQWAGGVEALLRAGAKIHNDHRSELIPILKKRWTPGLKILIKHGAKPVALNTAIRQNWMAGIAAQLKAGVHQHMLNSGLHLAVELGNNKVIDALLENGAQEQSLVHHDDYTSFYNGIELTALGYTIVCGNTEVIKKIYNDHRVHYSDRTIANTTVDKMNRTAISLALEYGSPLMAHLLCVGEAPESITDRLNDDYIKPIIRSFSDELVYCEQIIHVDDRSSVEIMLRCERAMNRLCSELHNLLVGDPKQKCFSSCNKLDLKLHHHGNGSPIGMNGQVRVSVQNPNIPGAERRRYLLLKHEETQAFIKKLEDAISCALKRNSFI